MSIDPYNYNNAPVSGVDTSAADLEEIKQADKLSPMMELGVTGLNRSAGYIYEEFLPQLRGRKAVQIYKEMSENDPLIGALIFAIKLLIRNIQWHVKPAGKDKDSANAARFVEECMDDMHTSWDALISECLSMLVYGWSWHEIVYKRRIGIWEKDEKRKSKHSDGLIGWRKFPIRAQETLMRWNFDESGETIGLVQLAPPTYKQVIIPRSRSLLFRFDPAKGNPEGRSLLRNAYRPWYMKKRIEETEAVGIERDLAGYPLVKIPAEMLKAKAGSDAAKTVEAMKKMVKGIRRNEQEGAIFPIAFDQDSKQPLYSFELLGGGGGRAFNTDAIIRRYEERMLMTVLADFIMVGHQSVGSYSLHTDKTGIFRAALNSIAKSIADVINREAIPKLFLVNGWKPSALPTIVPGNVDNPDLAQLSAFMSQLSSTGVTWFPDGDLENFVRAAAGLPELEKDELEKLRQLRMRTEATEFAQANLEYLNARNQMAMAMSPNAAMAQQQQQNPQAQNAPPGAE